MTNSQLIKDSWELTSGADYSTPMGWVEGAVGVVGGVAGVIDGAANVVTLGGKAAVTTGLKSGIKQIGKGVATSVAENAAEVAVKQGAEQAAESGVKVASQEVAESAGTNAANKGIDYSLKRPPGVTDAQWQKKLDALNKGAEEGRAKVVHNPQRTGQAQRQAQRQARQEGRIDAGDDADHGLDLQFGGSDTVDEIISTNLRVNRSVGAQGTGRKQYPDGTPIRKFVDHE